MTKVQDIDIALIETLKEHPDFAPSIGSLLHGNATHGINTNNFTSKNMARTRVKRLTSRDFIEYIVKNAILIYKTGLESIQTEPSNNLNRIEYHGFYSIERAMQTIMNPNINIILYYESNPNDLYELADAVAKTRFNPKWYVDRAKTPVPDPLNRGDTTRNLIDKIGVPLAEKEMDKITHDVEVVSPITRISVNYEHVNRCLREVAMGTQIKYSRNEYGLDGTLFATQDVGRKRSNQEDSVIILTHPENDQFKFLAVADGMGGLAKGEEASNYVVSELSEWFKHIPADAYYFSQGLTEAFENELRRINDDLYNRYNNEAGSTLVGAIVTDAETLIANIGDSRAYAVTSSGTRLLTRDESMVWQQMLVSKADQRITTKDIDDLRFVRGNNIITNCMGSPELGRIQSFRIPNSSYDKLLLLSDGVTDLLTQERINIIAQTTPKEYITRALVDYAVNHNAELNGVPMVHAGKDNATAAMLGR